MSKKTKNREILEELAIKDFGTKYISPELRGEARRLAVELDCSPTEALEAAREKLQKSQESKRVLKKHGKAIKKAKKASTKSKQAKKNAEVGRPKFSGLVQGGAPGLKSQK